MKIKPQDFMDAMEFISEQDDKSRLVLIDLIGHFPKLNTILKGNDSEVAEKILNYYVGLDAKQSISFVGTLAHYIQAKKQEKNTSEST